MSDLPPTAEAGTESRYSAIAREEIDGGARRDRTDDLMLAKHALSQLSYGPFVEITRSSEGLVGPERVERSTSRLSGVRSNHLSYKPDEVHAEPPHAIARLFDGKGRETKGAARRRHCCLSTDVWDSS